MICPHHEKLYGRRKCRQLTKKQKELFDTVLPDISITAFRQSNFGNYAHVFLEIGFGMGCHIAQLALSTPNALFVGCEPFVNGVAALLVKISDLGIKNIRIFQGDARILLQDIQSNSLDGVFLLFPDPWPKRKHTGRRFLQERTIETIHDKLKVGGWFRIATDHEVYIQWMLRLFGRPKFDKLFTGILVGKNSRPDENSWPKTKYERIATNEILFATYTKIEPYV
ncbi:MAG: tRNA (guanosine(46)-N7)-methyltransferase TrmB [Holosporales bacterium]|jgi:tRNA (guanine-N(7)-)-methyltransferase|nr:tRNA (guanosine(46)-N7)-methyltransferase TrmB [Holosporales bacterium]